MWLFKCDCGNEIEASAFDAKQGRIKSCGCLVAENINKVSHGNTLPNKSDPFNKLYGRYKRKAKKKRGFEFNLSKEEFKSLISKPCKYCGSEPFTELSIAKNKNKDNTLIYNGIDRKNSLEGYSMNNVLTCCSVCNRMKSDMDYYKFLGHIKNIYTNLNTGNN